MPGRRYGNVEFDGYKLKNYDFKAHSEYHGSSSKLPRNGHREIILATEEFGSVEFIIASGEVEFDDKNYPLSIDMMLWKEILQTTK